VGLGARARLLVQHTTTPQRNKPTPPPPTTTTPHQVLRHGRMVFAVTKKGAEQSQIRKELGHIIPHVLYYLLSALAVARVAYNSTLPTVTQEKLLGQGVSCIWIAVVLWQLYPPIGVVAGELRDHIRQQQLNKKGGKAAAHAPATDDVVPNVPVTPKLPNSP
jgi:hypothetical protein